jgi:hypothetical protein
VYIDGLRGFCLSISDTYISYFNQINPPITYSFSITLFIIVSITLVIQQLTTQMHCFNIFHCNILFSFPDSPESPQTDSQIQSGSPSLFLSPSLCLSLSLSLYIYLYLSIYPSIYLSIYITGISVSFTYKIFDHHITKFFYRLCWAFG